MTKEEALGLWLPMALLAVHDSPQCEEAVKMAARALEQEPCEDAISRQAVLNTLDKMDNALDEDRTVEIYKMLLTECITALPSITPKQKMGESEE